jgi:hypothetical protein
VCSSDLDVVPEINPNYRMNACFLCRSDKGKYRCTAVDVRECQSVYLSLFCFGYERIHRQGAVFETEVAVAIEKHGGGKMLSRRLSSE